MSDDRIEIVLDKWAPVREALDKIKEMKKKGYYLVDDGFTETMYVMVFIRGN